MCVNRIVRFFHSLFLSIVILKSTWSMEFGLLQKSHNQSGAELGDCNFCNWQERKMCTMRRESVNHHVMALFENLWTSISNYSSKCVFSPIGAYAKKRDYMILNNATQPLFSTHTVDKLCWSCCVIICQLILKETPQRQTWTTELIFFHLQPASYDSIVATFLFTWPYNKFQCTNIKAGRSSYFLRMM